MEMPVNEGVQLHYCFSKNRTVTADQWVVGRGFIGTEPDMIID